MNKYRLILSKIYRFFRPIDNTTMFRRMGVQIGENTKIMNDVIIDYAHYWLITIGKNVTIAPRVHILAHDASTKLALGYTKVSQVKINDNVFIGAGSIILPGVIIGQNSIIGAGSIVRHDIPENCVYSGNPAIFVSTTEDYLKRKAVLMNSENSFDYTYTLGEINDEKKLKMIVALEKHKIGFVQ